MESLTVEEAGALRERALAGDRHAARRLAESVVRLVCRTAHDRAAREGRPDRADDYIQDAMARVMSHGISAWEPSRGVKWVTYIGAVAWRSMGRPANRRPDPAELGVSLDGDGRTGCQPPEPPARDPGPVEAVIAREEALAAVERGRRLREALESMPGREATVLALRFGLDGLGRRTLREVGEALGVSKERVRQIQERALGRLRDVAGLEEE